MAFIPNISSRVVPSGSTQICGGKEAMTTWSTGVEAVPEPPQIEGATYLGCFQDMRMERTLEMGYVNNEDMTNQVGTGAERSQVNEITYRSPSPTG